MQVAPEGGNSDGVAHRAVSGELFTHYSPAELSPYFVRVLAPQLPDGWRIVSQTESGVTFEHEYRPTWTGCLAVLLFPIGLLALLAKDREFVSLTFLPEGERTRVVLSGSSDEWSSRIVWDRLPDWAPALPAAPEA